MQFPCSVAQICKDSLRDSKVLFRLHEQAPTHTERRGRKYGYCISHRLIGNGTDSQAKRLPRSAAPVILLFLTGCIRRTYAAIFSFCSGVMPPMPRMGRSLL